MATTVNQRKYLGWARGLGNRQRVYERPDGLEVDEIDYYEINRKRVYYDDVQFITLHKIYGWPFLLGTGLLAGTFGLISILSMSSSTGAGLTFFLMGAIPGALFLVRLLLRVDVITVYGKRSKAQITFAFRKARARETYRGICENVRRSQEALAATIAAEAPPEPAIAPGPLPPAFPEPPPIAPPTSPIPTAPPASQPEPQ